MNKWLKLVIVILVVVYQVDILLMEYDFLAREVVKEELQRQAPGESLKCFSDGVTALKTKQFNLRFYILGSTFILVALLFIQDKRKAMVGSN